jgi:hypothetical protein
MEKINKNISDNCVNDEVNYVDLLDKGRQKVNEDKIQDGLNYINLVLISPNLDTSSKITAL